MDDASHESVRHSYDEVAPEYLDKFRDELAHKPLDRALLRMLLERRGRELPVADVGCGPGHVAGWLASEGAEVVGIDLSAAMVEVGRRAFPAVEFRQGDLLALPASDGEFGVVLALYCIIHLTADELERALAELRRVLGPEGLLLVSFHIGTEVRHLSEWFGHDVDVDFRFFELDDVVDALQSAGFALEMRLERAPDPEETETRRGYVLARRPH